MGVLPLIGLIYLAGFLVTFVVATRIDYFSGVDDRALAGLIGFAYGIVWPVSALVAGATYQPKAPRR